MSKMRLHLDTNSAPTFILGIDNDMTIEDKYSLKKKTVRELVADNEWIITPEGLDLVVIPHYFFLTKHLKLLLMMTSKVHWV
eukprot:UN27903